MGKDESVAPKAIRLGRKGQRITPRQHADTARRGFGEVARAPGIRATAIVTQEDTGVVDRVEKAGERRAAAP